MYFGLQPSFHSSGQCLSWSFFPSGILLKWIILYPAAQSSARYVFMFIHDLENRNAMLAAIIDSSEDAIISKTLDGNITSWNKAAEKMFGYTEEEIVGQHIFILIPEDRRQEEDMIISKLRKGEKIEHYETMRRTKSGKEIHLSLSISPIQGPKGIVGASKIARDITRQKETEMLLRQHAERLELIDTIGKTVFSTFNVQDIIQNVTDATTKISGAEFGAFFYNMIDAHGETYMLFGLSGAPREAFEKFGMPRNTEVFKTTFTGRGILRSDDITQDPRYGKNSPHKGMPEGHLPVVSYLAVPVVSQTGIVIGGLFFGHHQSAMFTEDHERLVSAIASQAGIALENARLYEEIQNLNNKKDEFIGFASHELKTPITTISGYIQMSERSPELMASFMPKISKQVNRLSAIVSDLLDVSKIEAGKLELNLSHSSLLTILKDSVESVIPLSETHQVAFSPPGQDEIILVDAQKISQVISNLLTNALKYSPQNSTVSLTAFRIGDKIQVDVQDRGIGIAREHMENIFNRFYRVSSTRNRVQGLGIGLYLSREIIEAHRGKIWVESEEGKGSVFHVSFPIEAMKIY